MSRSDSQKSLWLCVGDRLWGGGKMETQTGRVSCSGSDGRGWGSGMQQWGGEKWPHSRQVSPTIVFHSLSLAFHKTFRSRRGMVEPCWVCQGLSLIPVDNDPDSTPYVPSIANRALCPLEPLTVPTPGLSPRVSHPGQQMVLGKLGAHMRKNRVGPLPHTTHTN